MFKSIEYKLIIYLLVLMVSLVAATLLLVRGEIAYGVAVARYAVVAAALFLLFWADIYSGDRQISGDGPIYSGLCCICVELRGIFL